MAQPVRFVVGVLPAEPIRIDYTYLFNYPPEFTTLPEYTAHANQRVTVLRKLTEQEASLEVGSMWEVKASDGWIGHAFDDELVQA